MSVAKTAMIYIFCLVDTYSASGAFLQEEGGYIYNEYKQNNKNKDYEGV